MNLNFDVKHLAQGRNWSIAWMSKWGNEDVSIDFDSDTLIDASVLGEMRKHAVTYLYCSSHWAGADLSVFEPVADMVNKIALPCEKQTRVIGLNTLKNLKDISISGDLTDVDFTKFTQLQSLNINETCKGGNWHLCESLNHILIDVSMANLKKLNALKNLRSLSCGRGLKSLEGISDLLALRELRIGGCHLPSLESLGSLPKLRLLMANLMPKLESLKGIEGLPNLEELDVTQCGKLRDVAAISTLTKLKLLQLAFCPHIKSLDGIKLPVDCKVSFVGKGKVSDGF